jgi:hypothetical protein
MEEIIKERQRGSNDFLGERGLIGLALFYEIIESKSQFILVNKFEKTILRLILVRVFEILLFDANG